MERMRIWNIKEKVEPSAKKPKIKVKVLERRGNTGKKMLQNKKWSIPKKLNVLEDNCEICQEEWMLTAVLCMRLNVRKR